MTTNDTLTSDLAEFGYRELGMAGDLLKAYADNPADFLGNGVRVWFNKRSGFVFLSDEDCLVGVMEAGKLVQFHSCPECGWEGTVENFATDVTHDNCADCCIEYMTEIGALDEDAA